MAATFIGFVATSPKEGRTGGAGETMADPILSDQINHYLQQEEVNLKGFCLASQQLIESDGGLVFLEVSLINRDA